MGSQEAPLGSVWDSQGDEEAKVQQCLGTLQATCNSLLQFGATQRAEAKEAAARRLMLASWEEELKKREAELAVQKEKLEARERVLQARVVATTSQELLWQTRTATLTSQSQELKKQEISLNERERILAQRERNLMEREQRVDERERMKSPSTSSVPPPAAPLVTTPKVQHQQQQGLLAEKQEPCKAVTLKGSALLANASNLMKLEKQEKQGTPAASLAADPASAPKKRRRVNYSGAGLQPDFATGSTLQVGKSTSPGPSPYAIVDCPVPTPIPISPSKPAPAQPLSAPQLGTSNSDSRPPLPGFVTPSGALFTTSRSRPSPSLNAPVVVESQRHIGATAIQDDINRRNQKLDNLTNRLEQVLGEGRVDLENVTQCARGIAGEIFKCPSDKQREKKLTLIQNLKWNSDLRARILAKEVMPNEVVAMGPKELAPAETLLQRQAACRNLVDDTPTDFRSLRDARFQETRGINFSQSTQASFMDQ